jgi:hypothetical protein
VAIGISLFQIILKRKCIGQIFNYAEFTVTTGIEYRLELRDILTVDFDYFCVSPDGIRNYALK